MPPDRPVSRYDIDRDGTVTDSELALATPPSFWRRFGLRGPAIILRWVGRNAKRMLVAVVGFACLLGGVAMLVLPGPGVVVSLVGLAILATEFAWAERALDRSTAKAAQAAGAVTGSSHGRILLVVSAISLVTAGIVTLVALERFRVAGIGLVVAGIAALATLLPRVQAWLDRKQAESLERQASRP
jgi:hypothetical protein